MAEELKGRVVGGEGKVAEVDGGYFGGYVKPRNLAENRVDRRLSRNQTGKRKVVVIVRERNGNSVPAVFRTEGQAQSWIKARVAKGTVVNADEATSWDGLHGAFEMKRINHQEAYSLDGACTNWAEEYFSRLRRAEAGHHHHIAGAYLLRYAQESSWREDYRRVSQWRSDLPRRGAGDAQGRVAGFHGILATAFTPISTYVRATVIAPRRPPWRDLETCNVVSALSQDSARRRLCHVPPNFKTSLRVNSSIAVVCFSHSYCGTCPAGSVVYRVTGFLGISPQPPETLGGFCAKEPLSDECKEVTRHSRRRQGLLAGLDKA